MSFQVICLDACEVFETVNDAATAYSVVSDRIAEACLGKVERIHGHKLAAVKDGWIVAYEAFPEPHLIKKWSVEEHRRIMGIERERTIDGAKQRH